MPLGAFKATVLGAAGGGVQVMLVCQKHELTTLQIRMASLILG